MDTDLLLQGFVTLLDDTEARWAFIAYVTTCVLGQIGNAVWLWLGREIDCVLDRFRQDPRSSVKAILAQLGAVLAFAAAIPFEDMPLRTAIILGLLQGLAADSKLNRSARKIWSPAERSLVGEVSTATASAQPQKLEPPKP